MSLLGYAALTQPTNNKKCKKGGGWLTAQVVANEDFFVAQSCAEESQRAAEEKTSKNSAVLCVALYLISWLLLRIVLLSAWLEPQDRVTRLEPRHQM